MRRHAQTRSPMLAQGQRATELGRHVEKLPVSPHHGVPLLLSSPFDAQTRGLAVAALEVPRGVLQVAAGLRETREMRDMRRHAQGQCSDIYAACIGALLQLLTLQTPRSVRRRAATLRKRLGCTGELSQRS